MKAIQTKYLPASNVRGSRIKAWAEGWGSVTIPYPHEASHSETYAKAAIALCNKHGWKGTLISGGLPDQSGEVFVMLGSDTFEVK